jgi:hypothetical protein
VEDNPDADTGAMCKMAIPQDALAMDMHKVTLEEPSTCMY